MRLKLAVFTTVFVPVILLDLVTKRWALEALAARRGELFGGLVPLTLAFNKGAAFGISIGDDSRWFFIPVTVVALALLGMLLKQAEKGDLTRILAISMVVSGALGNLYDRVRWDRGVVDFLGPIDLGFWDFPIFNVADMAITCGAFLLAFSFWMEEKAMVAREARAAEGAVAGELSTAASSSGEATVAKAPPADAGHGERQAEI